MYSCYVPENSDDQLEAKRRLVIDHIVDVRKLIPRCAPLREWKGSSFGSRGDVDR